MEEEESVCEGEKDRERERERERLRKVVGQGEEAVGFDTGKT